MRHSQNTLSTHQSATYSLPSTSSFGNCARESMYCMLNITHHLEPSPQICHRGFDAILLDFYGGSDLVFLRDLGSFCLLGQRTDALAVTQRVLQACI